MGIEVLPPPISAKWGSSVSVSGSDTWERGGGGGMWEYGGEKGRKELICVCVSYVKKAGGRGTKQRKGNNRGSKGLNGRKPRPAGSGFFPPVGCYGLE